MKELLKIIEKKLGYKLPEERRHLITSLENIPESLLSDARKLESPLLAEVFLRFFIDPDCSRFIKVFIQERVFQVNPKEKKDE